MTIYPAIDLMDEGVVRLRQGDPGRRVEVGEDPVAVARRWMSEGAQWLHVVDLDGALAGTPRHLGLVERVCKAVSIPVQVGGGLRTLADLRGVFAAGASRAVLGTGALVGDLLHAAVGEFGDGVVVSLDARGGFVATGGWQQTSVHPVLETAQSLHRAGVSRFVYTDVARDGMLGGPDLVGLRNLLAAVAVPVILSGGIASTDDLRATAGAGAEGVIIGRALYEGHIALSDAIRIAGGTG